MNVFQKIMIFFDGQMKTPTNFGWFHIMCLALVVLITVLLCVFARKYGDKGARIVVLTYSILTIVLEIYKMLNYSYNPHTNVWDFQWYAFPFQFCSTPMYVGLVAGLLKKGKVQDALYSYLSTFALFAGLAVMFYPNDVFVSTIGINIQTMICHGGMVIVGIYLFACKVVKPNLKTLLKAMIVFAVLSAVALILNLSLYKAVAPETFNMFFISPYYECTLPLLSLVRANTHYIVFLLVYLIGFSLCALIVLSVAMLVFKIIQLLREKKLKQN